MSRSQNLLPKVHVRETADTRPNTVKPGPGRGYFTTIGRHGPTLLTDAQVIECRGRYEFQGWTRTQLAEHYGLSREYLSVLLTYRNRSKLYPKAVDFPPDLDA